MSKINFIKVFKNIDRNILLMGLAVVAIIVVGILVLSNGGAEQFLDKINNFGGMSKDDLAKKGVDYINTSILSGQTATLVESSEESGLVKIKISIGGSEFDTYVSKDGKLLFPEVIKMENETTGTTDNTDNTNGQTAKTCDDLVKTDKPQLDAFVVSQCPYGLQMQRVLADVVKSAPSLAENIKVRYLGSVSNGKITSMHGDAEAQENLKQICIRDEQASKYWSYVSCYMKAGKTDECLTSTGIDKNKLSECTTDAKRGLAYAQEDFDLSSKHGITGSPGLVQNNENVSESDFGGRTSEALKTLICCGDNTQSSDCSQTLNTASAASSFSETYEGSGTNSSANCQ